MTWRNYDDGRDKINMELPSATVKTYAVHLSKMLLRY
jgi:hypothetical protein